MRGIQLILTVAGVSALAACGHGTEERSASGGVSGVVAGALIAGPIGALAGAAVGGGGGAVIAKEKHEAPPPDADTDAVAPVNPSDRPIEDRRPPPRD